MVGKVKAMIGANSIYRTYKIKNIETGKTIRVNVQANKNLGICDVILPIERVAPQKPDNVTKESNRAYKEAKYEYDCYVQSIKNLRQAVMNKFQGKQFNDSYWSEHLGNVLSELLNR